MPDHRCPFCGADIDRMVDTIRFPRGMTFTEDFPLTTWESCPNCGKSLQIEMQLTVLVTAGEADDRQIKLQEAT